MSESPPSNTGQDSDKTSIKGKRGAKTADESKSKKGSSSKADEPSDSSCEVKVVKPGTKQTKIDDFSTKQKTSASEKDSVMNGSSKSSSRRTGRVNSGNGDAEENSKAAMDQKPGVRKRQASGDNSPKPQGKRGRVAEAEKKQDTSKKHR